jgi:hypothetical protein
MSCVPCAFDQIRCGTSCVNVNSDVYNCGTCGNNCFAKQTVPNSTSACAAGKCVTRCPLGYVDCDGNPSNGCETNVNSDRNNCGTCGAPCGPSEVCQNGACVGCPADRCANVCVSLATDLFNCGKCGASCQSFLNHANGSCVNSSCTFVCSSGYLDCDGNVLSGCETPVSEQNCGACGVSCGAGQFCSKAKSCKDCAPSVLGTSLPLSVSGTTIGNPDVFQPSCSGGGGAPDATFRFTAPSTARYSFDATGSSFDAVIEVHDTSCGGASLGCAVSQPLSLNLMAGQSVIVVIDGYFSSQGPYVLQIN